MSGYLGCCEYCGHYMNMPEFSNQGYCRVIQKIVDSISFCEFFANEKNNEDDPHSKKVQNPKYALYALYLIKNGARDSIRECDSCVCDPVSCPYDCPLSVSYRVIQKLKGNKDESILQSEP